MLNSSLLISLDDETDVDPVLDLAATFDSDHPLEVELGFGKGRLLLDAAQRRQEHNFIGVEVAGKYLRLAHDRARRRQLTNLRFVHGDAREFVEFFLPADSVRAMHVYFPDPWPKKKHHKRRLLDADFIDQTLRVLEPAGRLWIATDHSEYYEAIVEVLEPFDLRFHRVDAVWDGASTNYEDKFVRQGSTINRRVLEKR
ncbi:MAG TPA: tRNA (guanosine(46)-N7)-methyltransferase TrmB [Candidatus Latescibacteria bacterium]|nr:tRNA (guanosine(46)-N7)-methyltransferase TrmB [Candidatus Latescibacterota bacterium]HJP29045.1 tRNA (guanosine(46)-N7)-methyltransferase TrmB [Candidatus Latescibacterota bacterium]